MLRHLSGCVHKAARAEGGKAKEGDGGNAPREVKDADGKSNESHSVKHGWRCFVRRPEE